MRRSEIFGRIDIERGRQDKKVPGQWRGFASTGTLAAGQTDDDLERRNAFECLAILTEEVGEVARAIIDRDDANLTVELVQCAAVVTAWLEGRS